MPKPTGDKVTVFTDPLSDYVVFQTHAQGKSRYLDLTLEEAKKVLDELQKAVQTTEEWIKQQERDHEAGLI